MKPITIDSITAYLYRIPLKKNFRTSAGEISTKEYISAERKAFPDIPLMVDANNAYQPSDASHIEAWDGFNLLMIEQPYNEHDLYYHAALCARMKTSICLDESIETLHLADCAVKMKAADSVNIKVCRVGGLVQSLRIHDLCASHAVPVRIGSRIGTGVANAARLAAASLPNAVFPSDVGFDAAYIDDDLLAEPFETRNGCELHVPAGHGLGMEVDRDRLGKYTLGRKSV